MFKKGDLVQAKPEFLGPKETLDDTVGIVYEYNPSNDYLGVGVLNPEDYFLPPIFNGRGACYEVVPLDSDRAKEINEMLEQKKKEKELRKVYKMKKLIAKNILWDIDKDDYSPEENEELLQTLPTEIEIPKGMTDEDEISDYISDKTGFCHNGFDIVTENIKTLADLKRDACSGKLSLEMTEHYGKTGDDIIERLRGKRKTAGGNSVAIFLVNNFDGNLSELRFVSAKLIEYTDTSLTVYGTGKRDLNEKETKLMNEWNKKQEEILAENPFNDTYWQKKDFFAKSSCPWLSGTGDFIKGKRYSAYDNKVYDHSVRGPVILRYKVHWED